jgi:hypothetical protein
MEDESDACLFLGKKSNNQRNIELLGVINEEILSIIHLIGGIEDFKKSVDRCKRFFAILINSITILEMHCAILGLGLGLGITNH